MVLFVPCFVLKCNSEQLRPPGRQSEASFIEYRFQNPRLNDLKCHPKCHLWKGGHDKDDNEDDANMNVT